MKPDNSKDSKMSLQSASQPPTLTAKFGGKVMLKPGHSLMDWIRFGNQKGDLSCVDERGRDITLETLGKHNKATDAWLCVRGKVYNVTPYRDYHPGGVDELMRGAGVDATEMFDEIHKWVNVDSLLEKCYVGRLKDICTTQRRKSSAHKAGANLLGFPNLNGPGPVLPPPDPSVDIVTTDNFIISTPPTYDWYQTSTSVVIVIYSHWPAVTHEHIVIKALHRHLDVTLRLMDSSFFIEQDLSDDITNEFKVSVLKSGKVEVILVKATPNVQWMSLGTPGPANGTIVDEEDIERCYMECWLESRRPVTHDTDLLCVALPRGVRMCVPLGHHIRIAHTIEGMELDRSYTTVIPSLDQSTSDPRLDRGQVVYLMIKTYTDGLVTPWLQSLQTGDTIRMSIHEGAFTRVIFSGRDTVAIFAAGTGFTPMVRLIRHLVAETTVDIRVMFFNKTHADILWRDQIAAISSQCDRLVVHHVLSSPSPDWSGLVGRIRPELVSMIVPVKLNDSPRLLICGCGPTPFTKEAIRLTKDLGYDDESIHAFLG